jgi:tripartite-type tricarboxylate transporter receptor subunit TctC
LIHAPGQGCRHQGVNDLAAGNVDFLFSSYVSAIGQVQAGKLRVIGWTATKRSPALADVPTMAEAGPGAGRQVRARADLNPDAPAVTREAEEDWGKERWK